MFFEFLSVAMAFDNIDIAPEKVPQHAQGRWVSAQMVGLYLLFLFLSPIVLVMVVVIALVAVTVIILLQL